jgi:hypothetical protein
MGFSPSGGKPESFGTLGSPLASKLPIVPESSGFGPEKPFLPNYPLTDPEVNSNPSPGLNKGKGLLEEGKRRRGEEERVVAVSVGGACLVWNP